MNYINSAKNLKNYLMRALKERLHFYKDDEIFSSKLIHLPRGFNDLRKRKKLIKGYRDERFTQQLIDEIKDFTMVTYDGLALSVELVRYLEENSISGSLVELGTWRGGSLALMGMANQNFSGIRRELWGFDSFEGIPSPNAQYDRTLFLDTEFRLGDSDYDQGLKPVNQLNADIEFIRKITNQIKYPSANIHIIKGWFQESIPIHKAAIGPIALLRMDGDLYESYKMPLELLYDQVVPGGFIVFDDWMLKGCRKAVLEFFDTLPNKPFIHNADYSVRYIQKL